jgi:exodeoxyribonuclease V beta subunit
MYQAINRRLQVLLGPQQAPRAPGGMARSAAREELPEPAGPVRSPWTVPDPAPLALPDFAALMERGRPVWMFNFTGLQKGLERGRAEAGVFEEVKELAPPGGPRGGKKLGTLVHAMLERVDPAGLKGRDQEAWMALPATAELAGDLPREDRKEVLRWVHQAMTRPLPLPGGGAAALCQAEEMLRELDFVTPYPGLPDFLNGSIDVLFQAGGRAHVLDWKTNQLPGYGPAALDEAVQAHYLLQVKIYSVTACRFLGIRDAAHYERAFGGVVYVFLRGLPEGGVWTCRPSWDELQAWERELEELRPERWTGGAHHV